MNEKTESSTTPDPAQRRSTGAAAAELIVAVDIGGTQVKYGLITAQGTMLDSGQIDTRGPDGVEQILARVDTLITGFADQRPVGIAISTFGIIDRERGCILAAADAIRGYVGFELKSHFERQFRLPATVENDVNCVALAEGWRGAAIGLRNYLAITLGTGIGGGIVIDGQLYRGSGAAAGEWGYALIEGQVWEEVASLRGLAILADRAMPGRARSAQQVFETADAGDPDAAAVLERWFSRLAIGIANLIYAFNPEAIVVGGGICARGPRFQRELAHAIDQQLRPDFRCMTRIMIASTGNQAGMLGATRDWLRVHRSESNTDGHKR